MAIEFDSPLCPECGCTYSGWLSAIVDLDKPEDLIKYGPLIFDKIVEYELFCPNRHRWKTTTKPDGLQGKVQ